MSKCSRRDFLRLASLGIPALTGIPGLLPPPPIYPLGRVAARSVDIRKEPDSKAPALLRLSKDTLIQILGSLKAKQPEGNPRWIQVREGFIHSGDIQPVEYHPQIPSLEIDSPIPAEVSVPITQSYRTITPKESILYRFYYKSLHWVTGMVVGGGDRIWYRLRDYQLGVDLYTPGEHLRLISAGEYSPLSPELEPEQKWIEIRLSEQLLTVYEDATAVRTLPVSAGIPGSDNTETPTGTFYVQNKSPGVHMGNGQLTSNPLAYELPGVPWVCYFEPQKGIAIHGTFWHNDFGRPRSHGCINIKPEDALWIYRWTTPAAPVAKPKGTIGYGTRVIIR